MLCRLTVSSSKGQEETVEGDAVVFAVGVKAMQGIVSSSPDLTSCPVGTYPAILTLLIMDISLFYNAKFQDSTDIQAAEGKTLPSVGAPWTSPASPCQTASAL